MIGNVKVLDIIKENTNQISGTEQLFKARTNFQTRDRILHELSFFSPLDADNNYNYKFS